MKTEFRITSSLVGQIRQDLRRPHRFAFERVGFISARPALIGARLSMLAIAYHPVADEHYEDDRSVGAMIGPAAIRAALQIAYIGDFSMLHVHMHEHAGPPAFSPVDLREYPKFLPDFFNVRPGLPHGAVLLSHDEITGLIWPTRGARPQPLDEAVEVGAPLRIFWRT